MKERPILMSGPMVRAIMNGRKTQTRRVVTSRNSLYDGWEWTYGFPLAAAHDWAKAWVDHGPSPAENPGPYLKLPLPSEDTVHRIYPRWQPGGRFWVKETYCECEQRQRFYYAATDPRPRVFAAGFLGHGVNPPDMDWVPSIFCPRKASRITLEVTATRVERLQDITEADAKAEGADIQKECPGGCWVICGPSVGSHREGYRWLWEKLNGRGSWAANPWVWVVEFRRI